MTNPEPTLIRIEIRNANDVMNGDWFDYEKFSRQRTLWKLCAFNKKNGMPSWQNWRERRRFSRLAVGIGSLLYKADLGHIARVVHQNSIIDVRPIPGNLTKGVSTPHGDSGSTLWSIGKTDKEGLPPKGHRRSHNVEVYGVRTKDSGCCSDKPIISQPKVPFYSRDWSGSGWSD